mmetsp:Transcript_59015/g.120907  ORF Transcript_59015/g.120907 Transcript_59015/m.120907 type:complete len:293 (-) Transcript_59015:14-892(-)
MFLRAFLVAAGLACAVDAFAPSALSGLKLSPSLPSSVSSRPVLRTGALGLDAKLSAIIFACDGVLVDTERDGHRVALNKALKEGGVKKDGKELQCSEEEYGKLLKVRGEASLMDVWQEMGWDDMTMEKAVGIYERKNEIFVDMVTAGSLPIRPGVSELLDEAIEASIPVAVCSANTQRNVQSIVEALGSERSKHVQVFAGNRVNARKPSPDIFNLAKGTMSISAEDCVVIESDHNGLAAAKAAGMACLITTSTYTAGDDFKEADMVVDDLKKAEMDLEAISKLPLSMAGLNA